MLLCSCSQKNINYLNVKGNRVMITENSENFATHSLSDEQVINIFNLISYNSSGEYPTGYLDDIYDIVSFENIGMFETDEVFYYNIFMYKNSNFILIYDREYWICGCLYINEPIKYFELNNAVTFEDVERIDLTLISEDCGLNMLSADTLFSRKKYDTDIIKTDTINATLHLTDEGLFLVSYDNALYSDDSSNIKIISIDKVNDDEYCKIVDTLNDINDF